MRCLLLVLYKKVPRVLTHWASFVLNRGAHVREQISASVQDFGAQDLLLVQLEVPVGLSVTRPAIVLLVDDRLYLRGSLVA
jgi:hypothetical protein